MTDEEAPVTDEEERDMLLERIIAGEIADDAPEVVARERFDPELRELLGELRRLQGELDLVALRERVLTDARDDGWSSGEERMRSLVALEASRRRNDLQRAQADAPPTTTNPWTRASRRWILGLAAAIALFLVFDRPSAPAPPEERIFLGAELAGATPAGPCDAYTRFEWSYAAPPGWTYRVQVFDAATEALLADSGRLREPGWDAPAGAVDWPERIRWTLEVSQGASVLESWSVHAWRRRP